MLLVFSQKLNKNALTLLQLIIEINREKALNKCVNDMLEKICDQTRDSERCSERFLIKLRTIDIVVQTLITCECYFDTRSTSFNHFFSMHFQLV